MLNAHYADYSRGLGRGRGFPAVPPPPPQQEPAAFLARAATMAPNSWREIPEFLMGNGGELYGWRGRLNGFAPTKAANDAADAAAGPTAILSWGVSGMHGGLDAGCSMAYDPVLHRVYLPAMGGHEAGAVCSIPILDLRTLTVTIWPGSRLTERYVTDPINAQDIYGDGPAEGPLAAHTWMGVVWDALQSKVFLCASLGSFGIHANTNAGFQPADRPPSPKFWTAGRPLKPAFNVPGTMVGWQINNWISEFTPGVGWERLVPDLLDPRNRYGYNNTLVYDPSRQRVSGFPQLSGGAGGYGGRLGYWDRNQRNFVTYGSANQRTIGGGTAPQATIVFHVAEDKFYWLTWNNATLSIWLVSCPADGSAVQTLVAELPRRSGIITGYDYGGGVVQPDCPADQTSRLDPATQIGWFSFDQGLCYCPADQKLYLTNADGYGQVWRWEGTAWQTLNPAAPWPWCATLVMPPWSNPHHSTQIFNRFQYICQSADGKPLFLLVSGSIGGAWIYKGA